MNAAEVAASAILDLCFTLPAYVVIYAVIAACAQRVANGPGVFAVVFGLGQALGDGIGFFLASPTALWLAPWVMLNDMATHLGAYLWFARAIDAPRAAPRLTTIVGPIAALVAVYWVCGAVIAVVADAVGL